MKSPLVKLNPIMTAGKVLPADRCEKESVATKINNAASKIYRVI
jgi:hypothetical protein